MAFGVERSVSGRPRVANGAAPSLGLRAAPEPVRQVELSPGGVSWELKWMILQEDLTGLKTFALRCAQKSLTAEQSRQAFRQIAAWIERREP